MTLSQRQITSIISAAIIIITLIAYSPIRHNSFVHYDDYAYIIKNPIISSGVSVDAITNCFTKIHASNWHPLTWLSHLVDYQLFGLNPPGHHIVSVIFHIINALMLLWVLRLLSISVWSSAFISVIFALHPIQVESVAWASERKTLLAGLFWLLTMAVYIYYTRRPGVLRYLLLIAIYALCIMTKPVVVTLAFVLLLLDYWPLNRIRQRQKIKSDLNQQSIGWLILEKIPLLVLSAILCVVTIIAQRTQGAVIGLENLPLNTRMANVFVSYIKYIGKTLWPQGLSVFYPPSNPAFSSLSTLIYISIFLILFFIFIRLGYRRKYLTTGLLWFTGTLVPMIGIVQAGFQSMANRYMYISIIGLLIIISIGASELIGKSPKLKPFLVIASFFIISILLILTRMQVKYWQNSTSLFEYAISSTQDHQITENAHGCALFTENRLDEAEQHFLKALKISPSFDTSIIHLARLYLKEGRFDEATAAYQELITRNRSSAELYYNLAMAFYMQEKYEDAIKSFNKSLEFNQNDPDTHKRMAITLLEAGNANEALEHAKRACELTQYNDAESLDTLGMIYSAQAKFNEAKAAAQKAFSIAKFSGQEDLALEIQKRIKLYEARQPYRQQ